MEELVESILDYVRADYTDYAVMINGEWGSGKTYFWNNKVRKKIESMTLNRKSIYDDIYVFISEYLIWKKLVKKYLLKQLNLWIKT